MEQQKLPRAILETWRVRVLCPNCRRVQYDHSIAWEPKTEWKDEDLRGQALTCVCGVTFQVPVGLPSDAAPALLEACEVALAHLEENRAQGGWTRRILEEAIAKARGEEANDG